MISFQNEYKNVKKARVSFLCLLNEKFQQTKNSFSRKLSSLFAILILIYVEIHLKNEIA